MKMPSIILTTVILFSCSGKPADTSQPLKPETPAALQDDKIDLKSISREIYYSDLIEELYKELVDKRPELKKLEEDLENMEKNKSDELEKFNKYDAKSTSYYNSANEKIANISDSALKNKIDILINRSEDHYSLKKADLLELISKINKNDLSLNDNHILLKIVLTMNLIENYQADNKPGSKGFNEIIKEQKNLLHQADSLTPDL